MLESENNQEPVQEGKNDNNDNQGNEPENNEEADNNNNNEEAENKDDAEENAENKDEAEENQEDDSEAARIKKETDYKISFFEAVNSLNEEELVNYFKDLSTKVWEFRIENNITALHRAVFLNSEKITKLIIEQLKKRLGFENRVDFKKFINEATTEGLTALHYAAYNGNISLAKLLIDYGASADALTNRGKNLMHIAAEGNQPSIMVYFMYHHAQDIFSIDEKGSTPLHWACYSGAEETVEFLINQHANIDAIDKEGYTPLHLAVLSNRDRIVLRLLRNGANKSIKSNNGETPFNIAMKKNYFSIINLLEDKYYSPLITLVPPSEYIAPKNTYKILTLVCVIVPVLLMIFLVLPFMEGITNPIITVVFFALCLFSYFFLLMKNPNEMTNNSLLQKLDGKDPLIVLVDEGYDIKSFCTKCYVMKSNLCKHCFLCNKCIEGFDHHCFWLNKCIGTGNKAAYLIFLLFTLVYIFMCIYCGVNCYNNDAVEPRSDLYVWFKLFKGTVKLKNIFSFIVVMLATVASFPISFLFIMHAISLIENWELKKDLVKIKNKIIKKKPIEDIKEDVEKNAVEIPLIEKGKDEDDEEVNEEDMVHPNLEPEEDKKIEINFSGKEVIITKIGENDKKEEDINTDKKDEEVEEIVEEIEEEVEDDKNAS